MKILLVTSSARGHAIAETLSRSRHNPDIISVCANRNPGIRKLAAEQYTVDPMDFDSVVDIAKKAKPDFAFIGPDDPIGAGLADILENAGIPTVAPKKSLARVESSKGFTRELLQKKGIDCSPKFSLFNRAEPKLLYTYITQELEGEYVVKYDELKGGKGVKISGEHLASIEEGVAYALECIAECGQVVIEEKLRGVEFSLLSFVSGTQVVDMPAVQDHKRAYEGDIGPNTGGMGTYSDVNHSLPFLEPSDLERAKEINRLSAKALLEECGEPFRGILYGGFIAVKNGIRLIEYNARFGDPEALNILPLLSSDFVDICQAMISGELQENLVSFEHKATVCKYITPESYPIGKAQKGKQVVFPPIPNNARVYYGDVSESDEGTLLLGGSRAAGIVGIGDSLADAESVAQQLCEQVTGPVRFRSDIGTAEVISQRVTTLKQLRASSHSPE